MTGNFHISIQKSPTMFPKIVTKAVYIRKRIKTFRFHMNPQKSYLHLNIEYMMILYIYHNISCICY